MKATLLCGDLFVVSLNAESRVKVQRGPANARLPQAGYTPVLVKVVNESTVTKQLQIDSPQAGPVYAGVAPLSMTRQQQESSSTSGQSALRETALSGASK
jgi:hypothetical protein